MIKAYLAGPDVFRGNAKEVLAKKRQVCELAGIVALTPLDNEFNNDLSGKDLAKLIYGANIELIQEADIIFADITPFRGISLDPGTAFEIGYAIALGKRVYAYDTSGHSTYKQKVNANFRVRNSEHPIVEDFGLTENLMISAGVDYLSTSFESAINIAKLVSL